MSSNAAGVSMSSIRRCVTYVFLCSQLSFARNRKSKVWFGVRVRVFELAHGPALLIPLANSVLAFLWGLSGLGVNSVLAFRVKEKE